LPFQWHFTKQNGVIRLKSNILAPPKIFWPTPNFWDGYATAAKMCDMVRNHDLTSASACKVPGYFANDISVGCFKS